MRKVKLKRNVKRRKNKSNIKCGKVKRKVHTQNERRKYMGKWAEEERGRGKKGKPGNTNWR
jgi:hypothetical protein